MKEHYCDFCGKDTTGIDYDYLIGHNHLACILSDELKKEKERMNQKPLEIENWDKLSGQRFDVMGASFVIMDSYVESLQIGNAYICWIHPWNDSEALIKVTLWADNMELQLKILPPMDYDYTLVPIDLTTTITKVHISNPSIFVQTIAEGLVDDPSVRDILSYIGRKQDNLRLGKKGIVNNVLNSGTTATFGSSSLW